MNWLNNTVLLGRLAILPLALLQWGSVLVLLPRLLSFPRGSWQRVSIDAVLIAATVGVVFAQIHGYQWITSRRRANDDDFVAAVIILESFFTLFLTIVVLKRKGVISSKGVN